MLRITGIILAFMLLGMISLQPVLADTYPADPSSEDSNTSLKVMAFNGADIFQEASGGGGVLATAPCGTILPFDGKQEGPWFHVTYGSTKGWVSGDLTSFHIYDVFCLAVIPAEQPAVVTQSAAPSVLYGGSYEDTIAAAAATYGADYYTLLRVAECESSLRLDAQSWAGAYGPFQFLQSTFIWLQDLSGIPGDWRDPTAQANIAAWAFAQGKGNLWDCY